MSRQKKKPQRSNIINLPHEDVFLEERPKVRFRRTLFSFFIVIIISSIVYITTPISRLGVIYFTGLNTLTRSDLISLIEISDDELFLSIRLSGIQANIETHPAVQQATVSRTWLNRIRIEIEEYEVAACALIEGEMFHILTDGELLAESRGMRANCDKMVIHGLTQKEVAAEVPKLFVRQLMRVEPKIRTLIQMIEYEPFYGDIYRFSLTMIDGNTVKVTIHTMHEELNMYLDLISRLQPGVTGTLHLDIGDTGRAIFVSYE